MLREIAWRLREIGNDGRICDLIDSQVTVIEKGTEQFSSEEARAALRAAFAALQGRLVEFGDEDGAPVPAAESEAAAPSPAAQEMPPAAETAFAQEAPETAETPFASMAASAEAVLAAAEAVLTEAETPLAAESARAPEASVEDTAVQDATVQHAAAQDNSVRNADAQDADAQDADTQDADAQDEAILDMIAMEMGAPDPISDEEIAEAIAEQVRLAEPAPIAPKIVAKAPEPVATASPQPVQQTVQPSPPPAAAPAPTPAVEVSLGSTLIASGMLRKPVMAANDPLAPIRRMSQAEKIAFFS
ncbi:chemotaxis protein histidine kinase CheA [Bradyrhizobium sp. AZCC 1614]|uniref:hypothetical protein n=1 Tax=Bradyrhizobium sp. AZCC 1614 TaxID=3117017 RepID=UPI002FEEBDC4